MRKLRAADCNCEWEVASGMRYRYYMCGRCLILEELEEV
jgi:hypothetical protein